MINIIGKKEGLCFDKTMLAFPQFSQPFAAHFNFFRSLQTTEMKQTELGTFRF